MSSSQSAKESWFSLQNKKRASRALERQREYQAEKSGALAGSEKSIVLSMFGSSQKARKMIEAVKPIAADVKILEVGSGAHGLVFEFGNEFRIGVDPLAVEYANFFPHWQRKVPTIAARGEELPFADRSFDVVISDNVIDHAEKPLKIIEELVRVLKVGGVMYFTVNVHHAFYSAASDVYGVYKALGLPLEVTPFADHTVHLTAAQVQKTFANLPLKIVHQKVSRVETKNIQRRHIGDNIKRIFFKNALFESLAVRQ